MPATKRRSREPRRNGNGRSESVGNETVEPRLYLALAICSALGAAPKWKNPSERYVNACKNYPDARAPIAEDGISHFVYFAREREAMRGHVSLKHPRFEGAQILCPLTSLGVGGR